MGNIKTNYCPLPVPSLDQQDIVMSGALPEEEELTTGRAGVDIGDDFVRNIRSMDPLHSGIYSSKSDTRTDTRMSKDHSEDSLSSPVSDSQSTGHTFTNLVSCGYTTLNEISNLDKAFETVTSYFDRNAYLLRNPHEWLISANTTHPDSELASAFSLIGSHFGRSSRYDASKTQPSDQNSTKNFFDEVRETRYDSDIAAVLSTMPSYKSSVVSAIAKAVKTLGNILYLDSNSSLERETKLPDFFPAQLNVFTDT